MNFNKATKIYLARRGWKKDTIPNVYLTVEDGTMYFFQPTYIGVMDTTKPLNSVVHPFHRKPQDYAKLSVAIDAIVIDSVNNRVLITYGNMQVSVDLKDIPRYAVVQPYEQELLLTKEMDYFNIVALERKDDKNETPTLVHMNNGTVYSTFPCVRPKFVGKYEVVGVRRTTSYSVSIKLEGYKSVVSLRKHLIFTKVS